MGLEATMILVDNSEYSRNGDFFPSRWEAQKDSVNILAQSKLQSNVESGVGLMTMANRQPEVQATPTTDKHQVMSKFHQVKQEYYMHLTNSLQIAQLVLKHRINKVQKQKIIVFIASPVEESESKLVSLAKKLKKNSVGVDIINIGVYDQAHLDKLQKFIQTINSSDDNSHFLSVPPCAISNLTAQIVSSPILNQNAQQEWNQGDDGLQGVDDPDLAMAIRMSLEEEKRKQEEAKQQKQEQPIKPIEEESAVMQEEKMELEDNDDEEQQLLDKARLLSLDSPGQKEEEKDKQQQFQDPSFVDELLSQIQDIDQTKEEQDKPKDKQ